MMINRIALSISALTLIIVTGLGFWLVRYQTSWVYVDSVRLINGYKGMEEARKEYDKKTTTWKANVDTLAFELQQALVRYERERQKLSAKERQDMENNLRGKQNQLSEYQKAVDAQARDEDEKMTKEVIDKINSYLKRHGKERGYKLVIAANQYGTVAYADEGLDITDEVLEGLNKEYERVK
jgi:outer membrane protein